MAYMLLVCSSTDGWHQVDSSQGMTIKNQIVGFLVAVQYLQGASSESWLCIP